MLLQQNGGGCYSFDGAKFYLNSHPLLELIFIIEFHILCLFCNTCYSNSGCKLYTIFFPQRKN